MSEPQPPRLLDQVRQALRLRHFSLKTEKSYVHSQKVRRHHVYEQSVQRAVKQAMSRADIVKYGAVIRYAIALRLIC